MITINGTTWTDKGETLDLHAKFYELYGKNSEPPICSNKIRDKVCGNVTCYIVLNEEDVRKDPMKYGWSFAYSSMSHYKLDGKIYLPIRTCVACGAARDGWETGYYEQDKKDRKLRAVPGMSLTPEEQVKYREVFIKAYDKAVAQKEAKQSSKSRYTMNK